ncbi:MAG: type IX secretion system protein PorQ [Bacteroidota bacterium]
MLTIRGKGVAYMAGWLAVLAAGPAGASTPTTFHFLRAEVSARSAAVAGSGIAVGGDPSCLFTNPAAAGVQGLTNASVGFFKHLLDINAGFAAYTRPFEGIGTLSAGIQYYNYGKFDETDERGNIIGSFGAGDFALTLGWADLVEENLRVGGNLKVIYSSIAGYSASGLGTDLGVYYEMPENRMTLGMSVRNLGFQLGSYNGVKEALPLDVAVGGSVVPRGIPLLLSVAFEKLNAEGAGFGDRFRAFSVGAEFTLSPSFQLRFGYNNEERRDLKVGTSSGLAGFSGGFGIRAGEYRVDYALSSLGGIGSLHRFTLGTNL